nr:hypothetical protein [Tanacetum cinerariifolium]
MYGAILLESLTSLEMKETQACRTYLGFATGAIPPKKVRHFKKLASPQLTTVPVSSEEPTKKSKRVKRSAKKSTKSPAGGVVIRETPKMPLSKKKEKVDVARDDANNEQDSRSERSDEKNDSDDKNTQSDSEKCTDSEHETDENESDSESDQEENKEEIGDDKEEEEDEFIRTPSNDSDDETQISDKLNEPVDADEGFIQKEGTDAEMTKKTKVPVTSSSHSSDLASKFLKFLDIPHTNAYIVSPMDVHVHHEVSSQQTPTLFIVPVLVITDSSPTYSTVIPQSLPSFTPPPQKSTPTPPPTTKAKNPPSTLLDFTSVFQFNNRVITLEKEVAKLKKDDPLKTQVTALVDEHLDARLGATRDKFMNFLSIVLVEEKPKDKDKDKDPSARSDRGLKKRKTSKDAEPTKGVKAKESQFGSSKGTKSQPKSFGKSVQSEEPKFKVADSYMQQDQEGNLGPALKLLKGTRTNYAELEYDFEECYKVLSEKLDWETLEGDDYPFDLTKPLPLVMNGNCQMTKAAQYDLPGIEDMVLNIWSHVKVAYYKLSLWGISHWRDQRRGNEETWVWYLREIEVRRADNDLYTFKEGDFPRLRINDIEDMLILIVQNRLTNILGDDVFDFVIALRMFTKSIVIQKRVEDLQLAVERRHRLMRFDKLYKFSDGTLTRLRNSLEDITKNIHMKYLPKRRWSILEKKQANIMIKAIDRQLKERRMMRSLKKFVAKRHYGTDLRLLQPSQGYLDIGKLNTYLRLNREDSNLPVHSYRVVCFETLRQPPPPIGSPEAPQMMSYVKLPILKKGEYILWTMKMEQYLAHTNYALWEVVLNGNGAVQMTKDEAGNEIEVPPVTAQQILARTRERKAKSTLLMAIPDEHLARFYGIKDAKTLWAAIKPDLVGLDKGYDRFQRLLSLLEIHRESVSTEDANQIFLRSLPSVESNISLIMRNKLGIDNLDIDDLYNNLKIYKADIKGSSRSSSNSQNMDFISAESTSSTNELNAGYSVSTAICHGSQAQEQIDQDDLEEIDLKWDCRSAMNSRNRSRDAGNAGAKVKIGLGYDSQFNEKEVLDVKEEEVTETVFDNHSSDEKNSLANDRFKKGKGYHAVPPPLTGNYMPPKSDILFVGLDDSIYKFKISETVTSLAKDEKDNPKTSTSCVEKPKEDRALVTKTHNKTPYELLNGRLPRLDFMRPFRCPVTILNTLDPLGKFVGKADEGFLVGYSVTSKAFRGIKLTKMQVHKILMAMQSSISSTYKSSDDKAVDDKPKDDTGSKAVKEPVNKEDQAYKDELDRLLSQEYKASDAVDTLRKEPASPHPDAFIPINTLLHVDQDDSQIPDLEDTTELRSNGIFNSAYDDDLDIFTSLVQSVGAEADFNNMESSTVVSPIPTHRVHIDHPKDQILGAPKLIVQTKGMAKKSSRAHAFMEPKKVAQSLNDESWIEAMQEELLQPPSFIDPQFSNKVYKVEKALYGLHQAPKLGLQVKQSKEGIFISQDKFVAEILKKFDFSSVKIASTPIETHKPLVKDEEDVDVDVHLNRSMIGSLMYLTASRPDIMFAVCACSRDYPFDLEAYSDSDYVGANLDRKSTTGEYVAAANCYGLVLWIQNQMLDYGFNFMNTKIYIDNERRGDSLVRASTTASLDAQQDSSNVAKTQSKATLNEPTPQGEGSGNGLGRQETMGGAMAQDRREHEIELTNPVPQPPHDSPLSRGYTPGSDEGSMTLKELTDLYTTLLQQVLDLENVKTAQGRKTLKSQQKFQDIDDLVDKGMNFDLDKDADTEMIVEDKGNGEKGGSTTKTISTARPDISAARPEVKTVKQKTPPTTTILFDDEDVTIADTLVKMKNHIAKEKGIAFKGVDDSARPIRSITTLQPLPTIDPKDKDLDEEARTKRERQEEASKAALAKMYDKVQAQIDDDHELAARLTYEEQEKYIVEERSKLLVKFFEKRKKQLAKERAEAIRSKPPTKTQLRNLMMTYLKNTGSEEDEKIRSRKKRAASSSSKQKSPKKLKVNDQEYEDSDNKLRKCLKMVPDDDKTIDYETLDVKSLIVDCESQVLKTNEAGDVHVYKLTRLDGSYRHFSTFSRMLEVLNRKDVLDLHKIIIERFLANDPEEKRYPLTKEILEKMLSSRLEAETESTLALDLINGKRKTRKGQNRNKTGQKQEAWKSLAMSKPSHSQESSKEKKYKLKGPKLANPRRCIKDKLKTRADIAINQKFNYKG